MRSVCFLSHRIEHLFNFAALHFYISRALLHVTTSRCPYHSRQSLGLHSRKISKSFLFVVIESIDVYLHICGRVTRYDWRCWLLFYGCQKWRRKLKRATNYSEEWLCHATKWIYFPFDLQWIWWWWCLVGACFSLKIRKYVPKRTCSNSPYISIIIWKGNSMEPNETLKFRLLFVSFRV